MQPGDRVKPSALGREHHPALKKDHVRGTVTEVIEGKKPGVSLFVMVRMDGKQRAFGYPAEWWEVE